ncbi:transposase [Skermanella mucosa]|uniref:IS66-like element accessory protein TnpA n=1 Tax=Skermanella mucosa TaxID=1789672 RepID=UPI00192AED85|nr:transposase [Skermanella mucosa]UEM18451.1 transposase [Skermanella mucosa]
MQRVEIVTGRERRRRWSLEEKARLAGEAFAPGAIVSHVARRHGVAESCLYAWRKQLHGGRIGDARSGCGTALLIPVMLDAPPGQEPEPRSAGMAARASVTFSDGTRLEVGADYPAGALQALVAALRSRS